MVKYVGFPKEYNYIYCLMFNGDTFINLHYDNAPTVKLFIPWTKIQLKLPTSPA
jgi:hypothetical protein